MNAGLEVAVARQHGRTHQVVLVDGRIELGREVAGIADAGGAAVAGKGKAEFFQVRQQPGLCEVFGDDARARRQRGLDVRLHREARFDGFFCEKTGCQQHAGIGGVGAAGDGGDQHVAIANRDVARCVQRCTIAADCTRTGLSGFQGGAIDHHLCHGTR